jgi:alpha-tubulin suppressor-like RCC1 family protein
VAQGCAGGDLDLVGASCTVDQGCGSTGTVVCNPGSLRCERLVTSPPTTVSVQADPAVQLADGTSSARLLVVVTDANSKPVPSLVVQLDGGPGATVIQPAGPTDLHGQTEGSVTSGTAGQVTITATSAGLVGRATVTFVAPGPDATQSTLVVTPTTVNADGFEPAMAIATLRDGVGHPLAGQLVTLRFFPTGASSAAITPARQLTALDGTAVFAVRSGPPTQGARVAGSGTLQASSAAPTVVFPTTPVPVSFSGTFSYPVTVYAQGLPAGASITLDGGSLGFLQLSGGTESWGVLPIRLPEPTSSSGGTPYSVSLASVSDAGVVCQLLGGVGAIAATPRSQALPALGPTLKVQCARTGWVQLAKGKGRGASHALAIRADGSLWAWGSNLAGQLGLGTTSSNLCAPTPVLPDAGLRWASLAAGHSHSVAVTTSGALYLWGDNSYGQLGLGDATARLVPTRLGADAWQQVVAGANFTVGIHSDGTLWAWGDDASGQLGDGQAAGTFRRSPNQIGSDRTWVRVAAGASHVMALQADGGLWLWGDNSDGQLGKGSLAITAGDLVPALLDVAQPWLDVEAGGTLSFALTDAGALFGWGDNLSGEVGVNNVTDRRVVSPTQLPSPGPARWRQLAVGSYGAMAIDSTGALWAWGNPPSLGLGPNFPGDGGSNASGPTPVDGRGWSSVAMSPWSANGILADSTLWGWGEDAPSGFSCELGRPVNRPAVLAWPRPWLSVTTSNDRTLATGADWFTTAWGPWDTSLGLGPQTPEVTVVTPTVLTDAAGGPVGFSTVTLGGSAVLGIAQYVGQLAPANLNPNSLWAWGSVNSSDRALDLDNRSLWTQVAASPYHWAAIGSDHTLVLWGSNSNGQLGGCGGAAINAGIPAPCALAAPTGSAGWSSVATGAFHTLAVTVEGRLFAWGDNTFGQLGGALADASCPLPFTSVNGPCSNSPRPVPDATEPQWMSVFAVGNHSLALKRDGSLWAWGDNASGQLGVLTTETCTSPVPMAPTTPCAKAPLPVPAPGGGSWLTLSTGGRGFVGTAQTLGVKADGSLWAWGDNAFGQLGDGTTTSRSAPVRVGTSNSWKLVSAGDTTTHALRNDGSLWSWGLDDSGQFPDGSNAVPQLVP